MLDSVVNVDDDYDNIVAPVVDDDHKEGDVADVYDNTVKPAADDDG